MLRTLVGRVLLGLLAPVPILAQSPAPISLREGLTLARQYRVESLDDRRFTHAEFWSAARPSLSSPALRVEAIGRSIHGKEIRAVSFGTGPTTVLLWSQMHGDESTATMALADLFRFLADPAQHSLRDRLSRGLRLVMVPMLNPDGAELFQRENAAGIDVNRDARALATPEARALKELRDRLRPDFGFNLHDQNARTRAGPQGLQVAIALLAPAFDEAKGYNDVRVRARQVAAGITKALEAEIPGRVARYDDTFNPRAFGDLMQQWGTSTVLIESGALPDDPDKQRLRALNLAALLGALDAIATRAYAATPPEPYERLPRNAGGAADLLVWRGTLVLSGRTPALIRADLALVYDDPVAPQGPRIREVGDLEAVIALDTLDARGLFLHPGKEALRVEGGQRWLALGAPARFDLRRGPERKSQLVRTLGRHN
ncbi:MAG: M14 family metallopeptidase [Gemmatimonadales bacterium]